MDQENFLGGTPQEEELKYLINRGLQIGENLRNHSDYAFDSLFPWLISVGDNVCISSTHGLPCTVVQSPERCIHVRGVERCSGVPAYTPDPDRHRRPESEGGADTVYHFPDQNPFCAAGCAGGDREREAVSYRDSAER